jgi:hypothetical protein
MMETKTPSALIVKSLVGHRHVQMALQCLGSLQRQFTKPPLLMLHDDGTLDPLDKARLTEGLNGATVVEAADSENRCLDLLQGRVACQAFRRRNVLSRKLFDIVLFYPGEDLVYSDTDILFLRRAPNLFTWPDEATDALFMKDLQESYSLRPWHLLGRGGVRICARLNSGLFRIRWRLVDLDFLEWFLGKNFPSYARLPSWLEQTAWAALAARGRVRVWNPAQVLVVSGTGSLTKEVVAAHFTSDARHYLALAPAREMPSEIVMVGTQPASLSTPLRLGCSQARRFVRNRLRRPLGRKLQDSL